MSGPMTSLLLVEDDPDTQTALQAFLHFKIPAEIRIAESLAEATEALKKYRFDCMLLDLMMPDGPGEKLIEGADDWLARPRIVVVSGIPEDGARWNKVKALGPDAMVHKPYYPDSLVAAIVGGPPSEPEPKG